MLGVIKMSKNPRRYFFKKGKFLNGASFTDSVTNSTNYVKLVGERIVFNGHYVQGSHFGDFLGYVQNIVLKKDEVLVVEYDYFQRNIAGYVSFLINKNEYKHWTAEAIEQSNLIAIVSPSIFNSSIQFNINGYSSSPGAFGGSIKSIYAVKSSGGGY